MWQSAENEVAFTGVEVCIWPKPALFNFNHTSFAGFLSLIAIGLYATPQASLLSRNILLPEVTQADVHAWLFSCSIRMIQTSTSYHVGGLQ